MLYTSIYTQTQNPCEFASVSGAIMTIIKLFLPFPPLFRRGVKVVRDIRCVCGQGGSHASVHGHVYAHMHHVYGYCRYATESTKTSQPQDADTQPGWAKLPPMGSIWGVKIQVKKCFTQNTPTQRIARTHTHMTAPIPTTLTHPCSHSC